MSNQYKHYPAIFIMRSKDPDSLRIIDLWRFRSTKSKKWYIVEMEHLNNNVIAVKFYYKGVRLSKNRYSLLTNDREPRTIVYSCFEIMNQYYTKDDTVSFGFVAAEEINPVKHSNINRRFRFYRILVNNYFGTETFIHLHDIKNNLYLMLNKKQLHDEAYTIDDVLDDVNNIYDVDFNLSCE